MDTATTNTTTQCKLQLVHIRLCAHALVDALVLQGIHHQRKL